MYVCMYVRAVLFSYIFVYLGSWNKNYACTGILNIY